MKGGRIGVIGGAGVAATNMLAQLVENHFTTHGATRDADHPEMIIWQATKAPSRSMYYEGKGPSFIADYIETGKKLIQAGADTLCMCCNTAHGAIDELRRHLSVPFIDIIEQIAENAKQFPSNEFVLLASEGCLASQTYQRVFKRLAPEVKLLLPNPETQKKITLGICNIKNKNRFLSPGDPESPHYIFSDIVDQTIKTAPVIIGCTDIRVAYRINPEYGIDSLETLSNAIIRHISR